MRFAQYTAIAGAMALAVDSNVSNAQQTITAILRTNAIELDTHNIKAGPATLNVVNAADNDMVHELVVLKTDVADSALPVLKGRVSEYRYRKLGEVEDVAPGKNKRMTFNFLPGHYVLICNKPGHYSMGMHTSLVVSR